MRPSYLSGLVMGLYSSTIVAEYRPNEHLVLMDCGFAPNGDSDSRFFLYYSGDPWDENNNYKSPDMMENVPWDGSYPWRSTGAFVDTANGDHFEVYLLPGIKDMDEAPYIYAGFAKHRLEEHTFDCYGWHRQNAFWMEDGTECGTAYICHHQGGGGSDGGDSGDNGDDGDGDGGDDTEERGSTLTISSDTITVSGSDSSQNTDFGLSHPKDAFHTIFDAIEGNDCKSKTYPISESCSISYDCTFPGPLEGLASFSTPMGTLLDQTAGPKIAETEHEWTTYSNNWGVPTYHKSYDYPRNGKIVVSTWEKGHSDSPKLQAMVGFEVECSSSDWFCNVGCSALAAGMVAAGYAQSVVPTVIFGGLVDVACASCP